MCPAERHLEAGSARLESPEQTRVVTMGLTSEAGWIQLIVHDLKKAVSQFGIEKYLGGSTTAEEVRSLVGEPLAPG